MRVFRYLPVQNYTKFDNNVMTIDRKSLKDGAKILYVYLAHFPNGKSISHGYIKKALGLADATIKSYVRELKEHDLIHMKRIGAKQYECFVGSTTIGASVVADFWKELTEADADEPITIERLSLMRKQNQIKE